MNIKRIADAAYIKALEEKCEGKPQGDTLAEKVWRELDRLPKKKPGEKNLDVLNEI